MVTDPTPTLDCFALVVGNARSGSTLVGAMIDAHPEMACANESAASALLWRDRDRDAIIAELNSNIARNRAEGRPSEGYRYGVEGGAGDAAAVRVLGDKIYNPTLLMLHGNPRLLPSLAERMGCPVRIVHVLRNPLDAIATMHRRSGEPVADRLRWYFMHLDAAAALEARVGGEGWLDLRLEDLIAEPDVWLTRLAALFGRDGPETYLAACRDRLFDAPRRTRDKAEWSAADLETLRRRARDYPLLAPYWAEIDAMFSAAGKSG